MATDQIRVRCPDCRKASMRARTERGYGFCPECGTRMVPTDEQAAKRREQAKAELKDQGKSTGG